MPASLHSFASTDRFLAEVRSQQLRAAYVLVGDEAFLYQRCRQAVLESLIAPGTRDFALHDLDLAEITIFDALDLARTPSLMAPFQVLFLRNLKTLYTRGAKKEEFAAVDRYLRDPNPQALLIFVADHITLPADLRRIDFQEKERFERIRETLGDSAGMVELARIDPEDATRYLLETLAPARGVGFQADAARELVDSLGANMLQIANEFEKLALYAEVKDKEATVPTITLADVELQVVAAKQRSLYELTDAITRRDQAAAIALLHGLLNASDGGEDAGIGHIYMLSRTFRQMLLLAEKNVRDSRALWQVLPPGSRPPSFAAEDLLRQSRRWKPAEFSRALTQFARADRDLRSSPPDKRLLLERLILSLTSARQTSPEA